MAFSEMEYKKSAKETKEECSHSEKPTVSKDYFHSALKKQKEKDNVKKKVLVLINISVQVPYGP